MLRKLLIIALAVFALATAVAGLLIVYLYAQLNPDRTPTYSAQLDMNGPTSTTRFEVWVVEPARYTVALRYPYANGVEREKAWALAGGDVLKDEEWREPGSPLVFQVRINQIFPRGQEVLNQQVMHPKLNSWAANHLNADLLVKELEAGHYQVSVQREGSLAETPPAPLELQFGKAHRGK